MKPGRVAACKQRPASSRRHAARQSSQLVLKRVREHARDVLVALVAEVDETGEVVIDVQRRHALFDRGVVEVRAILVEETAEAVVDAASTASTHRKGYNDESVTSAPSAVVAEIFATRIVLAPQS